MLLMLCTVCLARVFLSCFSFHYYTLITINLQILLHEVFVQCTSTAMNNGSFCAAMFPFTPLTFCLLVFQQLALYVLSFLEPKDLLQAAQTCRYWRILAEDNLLWREKCREEGESMQQMYQG